MEGMAEFAGIPDAGHVFQVDTVLPQKGDEVGRSLIGKAKHHTVVKLAFVGVARNAPENRKAAICYLVQSGQITMFKV